jgi:hypothetical protein
MSCIACRTPKEERCNKRTGQGERGQHPPQADRAASSPRLRSTRLAVATTSTIVLAVRPAGAHSVIASRSLPFVAERQPMTGAYLPHHLVPYPQPQSPTTRGRPWIPAASLATEPHQLAPSDRSSDKHPAKERCQFRLTVHRSTRATALSWVAVHRS